MKKSLMMLAFVLTGAVFCHSAGAALWTNGWGDNKWEEPLNWSSAMVPDYTVDPEAWVVGASSQYAVIDTAVPDVGRLIVGLGSAGAANSTVRMLTGGSLTVKTDTWIAGETNAHGTLIMDGGTFTAGVGTWLHIGHFHGVGIVDVNSGQVNAVTRILMGTDAADSYGTINLKGGTVTTPDLFMGNGKINITGGQFVVNSNNPATFAIANGVIDLAGGAIVVNSAVNWTNTFLALRDQGKVTSYGGATTISVTYTGTQTIVRGTHPLNPHPSDGDEAVLPGSVTLSWTNPAPNSIGAITCDVFFGTNPSSLSKIVNRQAVNSVVVSTSSITTYYWQVDCYDSSPGAINPVLSGRFSFKTNNGNVAPDVNAGPDVYTWLTGGTVTVTLHATLVDDGRPQAASVQWSVVSQPDPTGHPATFAAGTSTTLNPVITMTQTGDYVFSVLADDTQLTDGDQVAIFVRSDACAAAKAKPGFALLAGDINGDCKVDFNDFAQMAVNWLASNSL
jgi:hypothetical protein